MARIRVEITPLEERTALDIRSVIGAATLTAADVGAYLGVNRHTASKWLRDVDSIVINGRRRYQAIDIARKIEASRERGHEA